MIDGVGSGERSRDSVRGPAIVAGIYAR